MAFLSKIKLKKTGEVRQLKDATARTQIAALQTTVDGMQSITVDGTTYQVSDLLTYVAQIYGAVVYTE